MKAFQTKLWPFTFWLGCLIIISCQGETTFQTTQGSIEMDVDELLEIVGEAYLFGYPLLLMDMTKKVTTNIELPHPSRAMAPINQLGHYREFPDHNMKAVVKPNVDTYYSNAWLDLSVEPQILSMPATNRYYLLPFYDAYSNVFASPGTRTTGTTAQTFMIAGPDWKGETPEGFQLIQAPTNMVWMIGRIQVDSPEDGATTVKQIQDKMKLVPFSSYGKKEYAQPTGSVQKELQNVIPSKAIQELDVNTYLNRVAELMVSNPPKPADSSMMRKLAKIGLVPGKPFRLETNNLIAKTKLKALPEYIHSKMEDTRDNPDPALMTNGWRIITEGLGSYGTDYSRRAYIDFVGLGANWPEDAVYPTCVFDSQGDHLDASNTYQLHFDADQMPPVNAFWSITAYNEDEFLIENDLNRFALGDRDDITFNKDGSLDLYVQTNPPEASKLTNWLPIPKTGRFTLTMRLYWPKEKVMTGKWEPPSLVVVNEDL